MPRVKSVVTRRKWKKKVIKKAKGYWGAKHNRYRMAAEAVDRAGNFAFRDRRAKKRNFRSLWITRLNAAAHINGTSYSKLIKGLSLAKILINRKLLSDIAINDTNAFNEIVSIAKKSFITRKS